MQDLAQDLPLGEQALEYVLEKARQEDPSITMERVSGGRRMVHLVLRGGVRFLLSGLTICRRLSNVSMKQVRRGALSRVVWCCKWLPDAAMISSFDLFRCWLTA